MLRAKRDSSSFKKIRVGVIGATSYVAKAAVIPAIHSSSKAELVAMASRSDKRKLPYSHGIELYDSYEELMQADGIDAVYIPIPNALHAEAAKFAMANGKHVLCEKPLATSAQEIRELASFANVNQKILMEAYMTHYHPRNQELMGVVSARNAVKVRHVHAGFTGTLERADDFRWRPEMGGGSLRDVGVYLISPILEAAGQLPESVYGQAVYAASGVDESFTGLLNFSDGMTATIFSSFVSGEGQYLRYTLEKGRISLVNAFTPTLEDNIFEVSNLNGRLQKFKTKPANSYLEMVDHFCDLVNNHVPPLRPLSSTLLVQTIIDNLLLSAQNRQIVYLGQSSQLDPTNSA